MIAGVVQWGEPFAILLMLGGVIYLAGCFAVTMVFNVPMNQALAALPPMGPERAARWASYVSGWTTWNHVRTGASLLAAALLAIG